jgi:hypothetical protein
MHNAEAPKQKRKQMNTREIYHLLRRQYRTAKRDLLANNAIAICQQANSALRKLTKSWDVGLMPPCNPNYYNISTEWETKGNRRTLFVSRSLTNWLKA